MFALVSLEKIQLPPGSVVRLPATWQEYQNLCAQRLDGSVPRIKYHDGEVLLMSPLPVHGRDAHLIASIAIALLDHNEQEFDAFTPVTMTVQITNFKLKAAIFQTLIYKLLAIAACKLPMNATVAPPSAI